MTHEEAYEKVARIAVEHALIAQGFGGVLTVVHPRTQRQHGLEAQFLFQAGQGPQPAPQTQNNPRDEEQLKLPV